MEAEQYTGDVRNNSELVDSKPSVNADNTIERSESDKELTTETMKRDIVIQSGDGPIDVHEEQLHHTEETDDGVVCESTLFVDSSREDSDLSECEESARCQLINQSLRERLLHSVINPISDRDSKLRVSVFDHRIIPKKFIFQKGSDNRGHVDTADNQNTLTQTQSQENLNETNSSITNGLRKVTTMPYIVPSANRRLGNKDSIRAPNSTENASKMESEYEIRTRFDILLRNLIGDVDSFKVESSPMTVSSGYESDYIQTRDAKTNDKVNIKNECKTSNTNINGTTESAVKSEDRLTDYFTMSETYPHTEDPTLPSGTTSIDNQEFNSLPAFPTQYKDTGSVQNMESKDTSNSSNLGFFYSQRQNYKLTKVTRSMYEIIHDLQSGEKGQPDGKKRSRKVRRPGDSGSSDGNNSSKGDTLTRGRPHSGDGKSDNNTGTSSLKRTRDTTSSCVSGSLVRGVRRPQYAADSVPRPGQRRFSQSENEGRLGPAGAINSNKVQNDLRNLLCDTSDVTASSGSINEQFETFNMLSTNENSPAGLGSGLTSTGDNRGNRPDTSINGEDNKLNEGKRKSSVNEQFHSRVKSDDHVYETIPGDEKYYEEWKKMRTAVPRIRRFTTIPDLPGTFIPKEPPALPARKYLNNTTSANQTVLPRKRELSDSNDNYIVMGDINSNFTTSDRSDSGYTTVSSDQMLGLHAPQCFPFPMGNTSPPGNLGRHDETSDGYCSIDNLSLIREPVDSSKLSANERTRDCHVPEPSLVPPPPRLKRSDFFMIPHQNHFISNGFSLFNHEQSPNTMTSPDTMTSPEVLDRRRSRDTLDESNFFSPGFEPRPVKQSFHATYV